MNEQFLNKAQRELGDALSSSQPALRVARRILKDAVDNGREISDVDKVWLKVCEMITGGNQQTMARLLRPGNLPPREMFGAPGGEEPALPVGATERVREFR